MAYTLVHFHESWGVGALIQAHSGYREMACSLERVGLVWNVRRMERDSGDFGPQLVVSALGDGLCWEGVLK